MNSKMKNAEKRMILTAFAMEKPKRLEELKAGLQGIYDGDGEGIKVDLLGSDLDTHLETHLDGSCKGPDDCPDALALVTTLGALKSMDSGLGALLTRAQTLVSVYGLPTMVVLCHGDEDQPGDLQRAQDKCLRMGINVMDVPAGTAGLDSLAQGMAALCEEPKDFRHSHQAFTPLKKKIRTMIKSLYPGREVTFSPMAKEERTNCEALSLDQLPVALDVPPESLNVVVLHLRYLRDKEMILVVTQAEKPPMVEGSCVDFVRTLASKAPVPGGGGASALAGALGVALGNMVGSLTLGKKNYAQVQGDMAILKEKADALQNRLLDLVEEDAQVFAPLSRAYGMKTDTPKEAERKAAVMAAALDACTRVPLKIMGCCCEAIDLHREFAQKGTAIAISDVGVGVALCEAALKGASLNVFINTKSMANEKKAAAYNEEAQNMLGEYIPIARGIFDDVAQRFK